MPFPGQVYPFVLHTVATAAVFVKQLRHSAEAGGCRHTGSREPPRVAVAADAATH